MFEACPIAAMRSRMPARPPGIIRGPESKSKPLATGGGSLSLKERSGLIHAKQATIFVSKLLCFFPARRIESCCAHNHRLLHSSTLRHENCSEHRIL
eukprot:3853005-Rhodomonas_salina.2